MMNNSIDNENFEFTPSIETDISKSPSHVGQTTPAKSPVQFLRFISVSLSSHLIKATIEVDPFLTDLLAVQTIELFKKDSIDGFEQENTPAEYIQEAFDNEITSKIKYYFLYHLVLDFLISEIISRKITIANYPRLTSIEVMTDKKILYNFDLSTADPLELKEWKHFAFKAPKRKRYKDLDKQVISFVENKAANTRRNNSGIVEDGDWVFFDATLCNKASTTVSQYLISSFWFRIGHQEITEKFITQLLGRRIGESFTTSSLLTSEENEADMRHCYTFKITISAIVKGSMFSIDTFKTTFKLKNKAEIHNKLMEVFSYRNDISQRKAIIEEVFHLLLSKHRFEVPKHLVLRREETIIHMLSQQPDYHVYKGQKDFESYIELLAEKQLKEEIIIDQIAYNENLKVESKDISQYLHLLSNKRLKEFIYFKPLLERVEIMTSIPINISTLMQAVLREKTLNYIIHTLTK